MLLELNPLKWFTKQSTLPLLVFAPDVKSEPNVVVAADSVVLHSLPQTAEERVPAEAEELSMATAQTVPVVVKKTWLQRAGAFLRKDLHIGIDIAEAAEPYVDMAVPQVGTLYNGTLGLFVQAEASFGVAPGNGVAKLAATVPAVTANLKDWAQQNGFVVVESQVAAWASVLADSLNLLPIVKAGMEQIQPAAADSQQPA